MPVREELELYEMTELEARLLEAVRSSPEGASLVHLAEKLKIAPVVAGRVARSLVDMGKVRRKEDNRYYPVESTADRYPGTERGDDEQR